MSERPLWRWWLFCAALWLYFATGWSWASRAFGWCVLPGWVGGPGADCREFPEAGTGAAR